MASIGRGWDAATEHTKYTVLQGKPDRSDMVAGRNPAERGPSSRSRGSYNWRYRSQTYNCK